MCHCRDDNCYESFDLFGPLEIRMWKTKFAMIEVCEGECVGAVSVVIYYPTAQLMIFPPQDKDYTSERRQTTITTLSHRDHTVNVMSVNSIGTFLLIS